MSVAQRQVRSSTAFEQRMVVNGGMVAAVPQRAPRTTVRKKHAVRPKHVPQTAQMIAMSFCAVVVVSLGMLYLGCCAHVAHEQYLRARLQGQLRGEREIAERLRQQQAVAATTETVEKSAQQIGMVAGDESTTISLQK